MIFYKTDQEIELIRQSCLMVGKTHEAIVPFIKPGVKTLRLDEIAEEYIRDQGAVPGFKGYNGFPYTLCISMNEEVVHGMPSEREIQPGDLLSIDCGVLANGFYGDQAYTYCVGEVEPEVKQLLQVTKASLYAGIEHAVIGKRIGDICYAIQDMCERQHRYGVVRELVGHGIGRNLHESPDVPNYGRRGRGIKLQKGLVIAIEPMVNLGRKEIRQLDDGWTIIARDRKPSAHYEHTITVGKEKADILTTFDYLEEAIKSNAELTEID